MSALIYMQIKILSVKTNKKQKKPYSAIKVNNNLFKAMTKDFRGKAQLQSQLHICRIAFCLGLRQLMGWTLQNKLPPFSGLATPLFTNKERQM